MRLCARQKLEDCFDGSRVYRYEFDRPWDHEAIRSLATLGRLDYYPDFPRPFFRLCTPHSQVKGVEGDSCCRVILCGDPRERGEHEVREWLNHLAASDAPGSSLAAVDRTGREPERGGSDG